MKLMTDCSNCCICSAGGGCLAGIGDNDYCPADKETVIRRLNEHNFDNDRREMIQYLKKTFNYDYNYERLKELIDYVHTIKFVEYIVNDEKQFGNFYRFAKITNASVNINIIMSKLSDILKDKFDFYKYYSIVVIKSTNDSMNIYFTDIDRINKIKSMKEIRDRLSEKLSIYFDDETNRVILTCNHCGEVLDYVD